MTTRGTLKTEILDDLERSSTADGTRVLAAISAAIKHYQPRRFFFNESRSVTFTTVAADWDYTFGSTGDITTEFYKIDMVVREASDGDWPLAVADYRDIEVANGADSTNDEPTEWAYIDRTLVLSPIPDDAYTIRLTGHVKLAEPAADDTAGNAWFTEAYELIRCRAKSYLYAHVYPDVAMAQMMQAAEASALHSLLSATQDRVAPGFLEATEF